MKGRNFLRHLALDGPERYLDAATFFRREEQQELFAPDVFALVSAGDPWREATAWLAGPDRHWLSSLQHLDMKAYLPLDILTKVDRMSMAHSLEVRVPLLDHRLVEFAATLPLQDKLRGGSTKYLFKRALRGLVPDTILERPKRGFAIPLGRWFRGPLRAFASDLLLSPQSHARNVFERRALEHLVENSPISDDLGLRLWTVLSFELWCREFLAASPAVEHHPRRLRPERAVEEQHAL
jgi:asparagine synthase (glutamine-hydrolysing)